MSSLLESFVRRIEKLTDDRPTVPLPGTNHVDDSWNDTDIYPGELGVRLITGELFTSDGISIIKLNAENVLSSGLIVKKDTSGVNKLTVTSGVARINGRDYHHTSSGTDILLPFNVGLYPELHFVYGQATVVPFGTGASGNYTLALGTVLVSGPVTEPGGIYSSVAATAGNPVMPADSILLGTVLLNPGATGFELWPVSVSLLGDYYPKFSFTPSELLRERVSKVFPYLANTLYFPGQFLIDEASLTTYFVEKTFVSDNSSISVDIASGNISPLSSGGTGGTGSMTAINVGTGATVYKQTVGSQFQFRSILGVGPVTATLGASGDTVEIGLTGSFLSGATSLGSGIPILQGVTGNVAQIYSITGGNNVTVGLSGNTIIVAGSSAGSTVSGINLGATANADVFAGMSGPDLTFRRLAFGTGMSGSVTSNLITIFTTAQANDGINVGSGPGSVYGGMSGSSLKFRRIGGTGGNITVTQVGDDIVIGLTGLTGFTGASVAGINVGGGPGLVYVGLSGTDLKFRSLTGGSGISVQVVGDTIEITSLVSDGATGPQGFQGVGITGGQGFQGPQGFQGNDGFNGSTGPQGFQGASGAQGFDGLTGPQGFQGGAGPAAIIMDQRIIDVWDNGGGWEIVPGQVRDLPLFSTRIDTGSGLFVSGTVSQYTSPDGTYIEVTEDGNYMFIYEITATLQTDTLLLGYVHEQVGNLDVDGADILLRNSGPQGPATISATGKFALGATAGRRFSLRVENDVLSGGTGSGIVDASNLTIYKLEVGGGYTGATGVAGPTGPQGVTGPQGSTLLDAGRVIYPTSIEVVGFTGDSRFFAFNTQGPGSYAENYGSGATFSEASTISPCAITFESFTLHVIDTGGTGWTTGSTGEVALSVEGSDLPFLYYSIPDTVAIGDTFTINTSFTIAAGDRISVRTRNFNPENRASMILTGCQLVSLGPTGPQGPAGGLVWSPVPSGATAIGTSGEISYDTGFFYVCVATNSWKRIRYDAW